MHLSDEGILTQLGYSATKGMVAHFNLVKAHTPGFDTLKKHIVTLADHIRPYGGYITPSNSRPYFKIRIDRSHSYNPDGALQEITKWADKYGVQLSEVREGETFYILGSKK